MKFVWKKTTNCQFLVAETLTMVSATVRMTLFFNHPSEKQQPNLAGTFKNAFSVDEKQVDNVSDIEENKE